MVISGGTGGNAICSAFGNACYVLPVSDDGGSSSEIIRVLGGPSIGKGFDLHFLPHLISCTNLGDLRSRLIRLIPPAPAGSPLDAIRTLLAYRLPAHYTEREAKDEWRDIVEGNSSLWEGIPNDRKETIRGMNSPRVGPVKLISGDHQASLCTSKANSSSVHTRILRL